MNHIEYFKRQAKNLLKDLKTKKAHVDDLDGGTLYWFHGEFFDVDQICLDCGLDWDMNDDTDYKLMQVQHLIAEVLGFKSWSDMINSSDTRLEFARLEFEYLAPHLWDAAGGDFVPSTTINDAELDLDFRLSLLKVYLAADNPEPNHWKKEPRQKYRPGPEDQESVQSYIEEKERPNSEGVW